MQIYDVSFFNKLLVKKRYQKPGYTFSQVSLGTIFIKAFEGMWVDSRNIFVSNVNFSKPLTKLSRFFYYNLNVHDTMVVWILYFNQTLIYAKSELSYNGFLLLHHRGRNIYTHLILSQPNMSFVYYYKKENNVSKSSTVVINGNTNSQLTILDTVFDAVFFID